MCDFFFKFFFSCASELKLVFLSLSPLLYSLLPSLGLSPSLPFSLFLLFSFSPLIAEKVTYCLQWWGAERAPGGWWELLRESGRELIRSFGLPVWVAALGPLGSPSLTYTASLLLAPSHVEATLFNAKLASAEWAPGSDRGLGSTRLGRIGPFAQLFSIRLSAYLFSKWPPSILLKKEKKICSFHSLLSTRGGGENLTKSRTQYIYCSKIAMLV